MALVLVDYHLHLRKPNREREEADHTRGAVERYAERAVEQGIDEIGISEHAYYFRETSDFWELPYQQERCRHSLEAYCDAIIEARRGGAPVKLALEVDWVPGRAEQVAELLSGYPWDYLLGSVHWIDGLPIDGSPGWWDQAPPEEVWKRYARELRAAAASGQFDVLAHPDLVKIFGHRVEWDWSPLVRALDGVALEVSSAGLRKPVGELYPDASLLALANDADVAITLASDGHFEEDVGRDLTRAVEHARAAGYDTVTVFERRRGRQEPLG
jgi:histidinol-phosphatase (PHP family)